MTITGRASAVILPIILWQVKPKSRKANLTETDNWPLNWTTVRQLASKLDEGQLASKLDDGCACTYP